MGRGEGWRRGRGGWLRWMAEFCVHAFVCWGGQVYSKGRERCRKWLEIADALRGLQKINSSQEGKPQPPTCSPSLCLLMLPSHHLSCPHHHQLDHLFCYLLESLIPSPYRGLWALPIRSTSGVFVFSSLRVDHVISNVS